MKKLLKLWMVILTILVIFPFQVNAEEEKVEKPEANKEPVPIYLFYGDTCPVCEKFLNFLDSIEEEYGDYFDLVDYEVWNNQENNDFMFEVGEFMGDDITGVPYIVLGNYSYPGFLSDNVIDEETGKTSGDQFIERLLEIYQSDNRYDVMKEINNKPNYNTVVAVVAGIILVGIVAMVIITRKQNAEE